MQMNDQWKILKKILFHNLESEKKIYITSKV